MKKLITKILATALAIATLFTFTGCAKVADLKKVQDAGKIVVGITDYAPMDYQDENGKWIGFDAELAEMFAAELGVPCEFFEIADWGAMATELQANQFDLIWNGMTATEELGKQIDLSIPYAKNAQVLIINKNATAPAKADDNKVIELYVEDLS